LLAALDIGRRGAGRGGSAALHRAGDAEGWART
jgi:hypothetical protein